VAVARAWVRAIADVVTTAASEHIRRDRTVAHSLTVAPSISSRILGILGVLGGVLLLAAFVADLGAAFIELRITLFLVGSMAVVLAVYSRHAEPGGKLALVGALPALVGNAIYLVTILAAIAATPVDGLPGWLIFGATIALWLGDAWFGLITLRMGTLARLGPIAIALGSVLALTGFDGFGLVAANPAIFKPLSFVGQVLVGAGWILLGFDVATRRRASVVQPEGVRPGG
jgi:hypothetical protein